jgi:hypothetical protein
MLHLNGIQPRMEILNLKNFLLDLIRKSGGYVLRINLIILKLLRELGKKNMVDHILYYLVPIA